MNKIKKIDSLNGIRGFAVLLVLLSHASIEGINFHPEINFSGAGRYGVFLFFVLSSFLLTRQFLECSPKKGEVFPFIKHYFLRRFLRIYPLFLAALFTYYFLNIIGITVYNIPETSLIKTIFLLDGPGIFWAIPVEFQYYFLLPVISLLLVKAENYPLTIITFTVFAILWSLIFPPEYVTYLTPFLPIFILGSGAAYISHTLQSHARDRYQFLHPRFFNLVAIASFITFLIITPNFFNHIFSQNIERTEFHEQFFLLALLSCALILGTIHGSGSTKKIMESKFLVFWGKVSFSAYLGHMIILWIILRSEYNPVINWLFFLSLVAGLSYFSYKYFELPLSKVHTFKTLLAKIRLSAKVG